MAVDIRDKKFSLIERIMNIDDELVLDKVGQELDKITPTSNPQVPDINKAICSIRSNVTLEDIKREQNYVPITYDEFMELADEVGIDEPIEELLAMLTK